MDLSRVLKRQYLGSEVKKILKNINQIFIIIKKMKNQKLVIKILDNIKKKSTFKSGGR